MTRSSSKAEKPFDASHGAYKRPFDPAPRPGFGLSDFRRICDNGFGDGHNSFPHSCAWFNGCFYVGTTRSNFHMLKIQTTFRDLPVHLWPVEGPNDQEGLYRELDRRAQIWRYRPDADSWEEVFRSPMVMGSHGADVARETGLRAMAVFQGKSDSQPVLYVATWAVSRSPGALLLRSVDGTTYEPVSPYGIIEGLEINATRVLIPFKDRLFTSPTGTRGYDVNFVINVSGHPVIYESRDPARGQWHAVCESGFGEPGNVGIFDLCVLGDELYAGTFNNAGFQVWRSACEGKPPYRWTKILAGGAYRGALNQIAASMVAFKGDVYIGTAIQNGGHDLNNRIGPAGSELIRIRPDGSWDLIIGTARETPQGKKIPIAGLPAGFGNVLNGYFWALEEHDGWLYLGTMNSAIWLKFMKLNSYKPAVRRIFERVGVENVIANDAGCSLWRTADGENWLPVTRTGFDNCYNLGVRNLNSTPRGLFAAIANPFGPRVASCSDGEWKYVDNLRGGLEIWHAEDQ
jgi:hypothetical protein